jgi:small multidrug resistance pump
MSWIYLASAILLDVAGTVLLKVSNGFTRSVPAALMVGAYAASLVPFGLAARGLPMGVLYACWSALGTALVAIVGILWFKEPANAGKLVSLAMIIGGLIVMNLTSRAA